MPKFRESLFLSLWVFTPLLTDLSGMTPYPNQIYVAYELLEVCLCALAFRNFGTLVRVQMKWLIVLLLYSVTFIVVSYFGVDFSTSLMYGVLYLPMIVTLEFFIAFAVGYLFDEQRTFRFLMRMAFVLMFYTLLQIQFTPTGERFVSSLNLPMAIPLFVFSGQGLAALLCLIVLLLSLKKTIVVIGVLSIVMAYLLNWFVHPGVRLFSRYVKKSKLVVAVVASVFGLLVTGAVFVQFSSYFSATLDRFSEPEDMARSGIALYSIALLLEHFPRGIGWFGFLSQSIGVIRYEVTDARGDVHSGANLHNSYMTWALEGGLPIVLIMMYLFWKLFGVVRRFLRTRQTRFLGATLLIWLVGGMIFGTFQQWHSSGTFWALFGFAFGCHERYKSQQQWAG